MENVYVYVNDFIPIIRIFIVLIVLIIVIMYLVPILRKINDRSKGPISTQYEKSNGSNDEAANKLLEMLTEVSIDDLKDKPEEAFAAGNVHRYNLLSNDEEEVDKEKEINDILTYYGSTINSLDDRAVRRLEQLLDTDLDDSQTEDNTNRQTNFEPTFTQNDLHMVDRVEEFVNTWDLYDIPEVIVDAVPRIRDVAKVERRNRAVAAAKNRKEASENYFDASIDYASDPQNVHDSNVNGDLRKTLDKIKSRHNGVRPVKSLQNARAYIRNRINNSDERSRSKYNKALETLETVSAGNTIGTFKSREDAIFGYVWERSNLPENKDSSENLREALVDALADCHEKGSLVCINGRCSRMLGSLVLIDSDKELGNAKTYDAYKNEIYENSKKIIDESVKKASESDDPKMRDVAKSYEDFNIKPDKDTFSEFENQTKHKISKMIDSYDNLTPSQKETLKNDAYAGI